MEPERYQQIKAVLLDALERSASERAAFVAEACAGDDELRAEVESLLREHDAPADIVDVGFVGPQERQVLDALSSEAIAESEHGDDLDAELTVGMRVKQFELIRELGRGGMGQVFLAEDTKLGRRVALKFLRLRSSELIDRFLAEARATAQCHHENIVVIYEADEALGRPYLALEYLDGRPLSDLMEAGRMSPERAVSLMVPVVRALVCAHERGIVHRDLKPDNIFITHGGQVKVLDFGIAKLFDERERGGVADVSSSTDVRVTQKGVLLGTVPYMSPEQWGFDEVDHRSDLWAVGIILWQMLVGEHPVSTPTPPLLREVAERADEPMPSIQRVSAEVPGELASVVNACLVKQKGRRMESARALLDRLEPMVAPRTEDNERRNTPIVLRVSPVQAWVVMFVLGWILLGMSIGLGVGTSYTASINWGPNFIVIIPFLAATCIRAFHEADDSLRGMSTAGLLVDDDGQPAIRNVAFELWRERLEWTPWLVVVAFGGSLAVSVAEWWTRYQRSPVATEWWTQSPVLGVAGALVQGVIIGTLVMTGLVMITFGWTLLDVAAKRAGVRTTLSSTAKDGRGGFGIFQRMAESLVAGAALFYVALWASNVQHIAILRGLSAGRRPDLQAVLFAGSWFETGPAHYSIQMTIIATITTLSLIGLIVFWMHRAYWVTPAAGVKRSAWLVPYLPLPALASLLVLGITCFVFYRLGMVLIGVLVAGLVVGVGRAMSPK